VLQRRHDDNKKKENNVVGLARQADTRTRQEGGWGKVSGWLEKDNRVT